MIRTSYANVRGPDKKCQSMRITGDSRQLLTSSRRVGTHQAELKTKDNRQLQLFRYKQETEIAVSKSPTFAIVHVGAAAAANRFRRFKSADRLNWRTMENPAVRSIKSLFLMTEFVVFEINDWSSKYLYEFEIYSRPPTISASRNAIRSAIGPIDRENSKFDYFHV